MAETADISLHLRDHVEARITQLGLSPGEFKDATGLSPPALRNLRNGLVRDYSVKLKREVCRVLRWTPDSIDRLLRGEDPQALEASPQTRVHLNPPANPTMVTEIVSQLEALDGKLSEVLDLVSQRDAKFDALADGIQANHDLLAKMVPALRALKAASPKKPSVPPVQPSGRKRSAGRQAGRSAAERTL